MAGPRRRGVLRYYRQFEGMSDEEVSEGLRRASEERRRIALARVEPLDLSGTTWFEFPHPDVVSAVTYAARRGINRYGDPHAATLRSELAHRHAVEPGRVAVGNGAAELLVAAAGALLEPGGELVIPWPSYPLYPLMAKRAGGRRSPCPAVMSRRSSRRSPGPRARWSCAIRTTRQAPTPRSPSFASCSSAFPTGSR